MKSFTKIGDIVSSIENKKQADNIVELSAKTKGPTLEQVKTDLTNTLSASIDAQLPKEIGTSFGIVPYQTFKNMFADVYTQVSDKAHLMTGRVTHTFHFSGAEIVLRSLKTRERSALIPFISDIKGTDSGIVNKEENSYRLNILTVAIQRIDDLVFPDVKLSVDTFEEWKNNSKIKQVKDFLEDLDESFFMALYSLFVDLNNAKHYALVENLKNQ